jgi:hypothetical protein
MAQLARRKHSILPPRASNLQTTIHIFSLPLPCPMAETEFPGSHEEIGSTWE